MYTMYSASFWQFNPHTNSEFNRKYTCAWENTSQDANVFEDSIFGLPFPAINNGGLNREDVLPMASLYLKGFVDLPISITGTWL